MPAGRCFSSFYSSFCLIYNHFWFIREAANLAAQLWGGMHYDIRCICTERTLVVHVVFQLQSESDSADRRSAAPRSRLITFEQSLTPMCHPAAQSKWGACVCRYVLYWMRTAVRGHENPGLDAAKEQAEAAGVPLVIVAFVLTSHTHPTARRFKFWLEGLRDTQAELRTQV